MKCLELNKPFDFRWAEKKYPDDLRSGEALIKIHRVGICGTDYHAFRGKQPFFNYPRVLGHELGAEVIALRIDDASQNPAAVKVGDRVSVEPYLNCGLCQPCRNSSPNCCEHLKVLGVHMDGGLTEYLSVPTAKLHPSEKLDFEQLALVETLGIGAHAVYRAGVSAIDTVLVIGAGPIGLAVTQFVKIAGAKVLVLDINQQRLDFAQEHMSADQVILNDEAFDTDTLRELLGGNLPTAVFDATGHPDSMNRAFELVAFGGRLAFVGLFMGDVSFHDPLFHRRELTILASRNSLPQDFGRIIKLMEQGQVNTNSWLTHRADFGEIPTIFENWLNPQAGVIKAIVRL